MKLSIVLVLLFLLTGCATGAAHRYYLEERFPAKDIEEVELLFEEPSHDYIVMADLQVSNTTPRYLHREAARIGADAIIVTPVGGWYSRSEVWAGEDRHSSSYSRLIGTAIKYE